MNRGFPSLGNPPVVEVIAEVVFQSSSSKRPWSGDVAKEALTRIAGPDAKAEVLARQTLEFTEEGRPERISTEVLRMRGTYPDRRKGVQVGNDFLACHYLRRGERYDFREMLLLVEDALPKYKEFLEPGPISRLGLWFVDIVNIPARKVDLDEYFRLGIKFPSEIREPTLHGFDVRTVIELEREGRVLDLHFQDVKIPGLETSRFRVDWHLVEQVVAPDVTSWLTDAEAELNRWFFTTMAPKAIELFGPQGEQPTVVDRAPTTPRPGAKEQQEQGEQ